MAKSIYRCTSIFQGDRCKLSRYHVRDIPDQPFHAGNFTAWDDNGVAKGKAQGGTMTHKRNRVANRAFHSLVAMAATCPTPMRETLKADLGRLVEFYGGSK